MGNKPDLRIDEQFCSSCGEIIKKEAEICPQCGVRLRQIPHPTPGKPKRSVFKKLAIGCLGIVGAFIALMVIIAFISALASDGEGDEGRVVTNGDADDGGSTSKQPVRLYPGRLDSQNKDTEIPDSGTGALDGWEVTVSYQETVDSLGTFENAEEGNRFLVYDVRVKRIGDSSDSLAGQNMFGSEFRLLTPNGQVFDPSIWSKDPEFDPGTIVKGGTSQGFLTYEVPNTSGMHFLLFKPNSFSSARLVWGVEVP